MRRFALLVVIAAFLVACRDGTAACGIGSPCPGAQVTSLTLTPSAETLLVGDQAKIVVAATDASGAALTGVVFHYGSSNPAVATIDGAGNINVIDTGTTVLTVSIEGSDKRASSTLTAISGAFLSIAAGGDVSCALQGEGRAWCWGLNDVGQLGSSPPTTCFDTASLSAACSILPSRVGTTPANFASMSLGDSLSCGLLDDGRIACWGDNTFGQLGSNTVSGGATPQLLATTLRFVSVSAGGQHACAVAASQIAYCWGRDSLGQLGDFRHVNSTTPIPVVTTQLFTTVTAGYQHTCALNASGAAYCWGDNSRGQLGTNGAPPSSDSAIAVLGGLAFSSIDAGDVFTCGLANGTAYCWGTILGAGSVPTAVAGAPAFASIAAGGSHTCGLTAAGAAYCWGRDDDGQLGSGASLTSSAVAVPVGGGHTFTSLTAGRRHSCGIASDGVTYCWGSDVFGALGNAFQGAFLGLPQPVAQPVTQPTGQPTGQRVAQGRGRRRD